MLASLKDVECTAMRDLLHKLSTAQTNEDYARALIAYRCAVVAAAYEDAASLCDEWNDHSSAIRIRHRAASLTRRAPA